jgi:uncharacterized phage-associated protein
VSEQSTALAVARCIIDQYPYRETSNLTPLKLQKLCFFAAGYAWGSGVGAEFEGLRFEAWKHGPVLRDVYAHFRAEPSGVLNVDAIVLSPESLRVLRATLDVYGPLSAWALREQSHLEAPWIEAKAQDRSTEPPAIPNARIREHFAAKLANGVQYPEYLLDAGVFTLDGIPCSPKFSDIFALAAHVQSAHTNASAARH